MSDLIEQGKQHREWREQHDLSLREWAKIIKVNAAEVSDWENGKKPIPDYVKLTMSSIDADEEADYKASKMA